MDIYQWGHGLMWIVPLLFLVGAVLLLALLFRASWFGWPGIGQGGRRGTAREILDEHYGTVVTGACRQEQEKR